MAFGKGDARLLRKAEHHNGRTSSHTASRAVATPRLSRAVLEAPLPEWRRGVCSKFYAQLGRSRHAAKDLQILDNAAHTPSFIGLLL